MSIKTWMKGFYPVSSKERMTRVAAIEHSLRKWIGILPENLEKHSVQDGVPHLRDGDGLIFQVDSSSCALCVKYADDECIDCPLAHTLGHTCDGHKSEIGREWDKKRFPWLCWHKDRDPKPMIEALQKSLRREIDPNYNRTELLSQYEEKYRL